MGYNRGMYRECVEHYCYGAITREFISDALRTGRDFEIKI